MVCIKERVKKGDRIRLLSMSNDPCPIPVGTEGTVTFVTDMKSFQAGAFQIGVSWDNGRTLSLVEEDRWEKVA